MARMHRVSNRFSNRFICMYFDYVKPAIHVGNINSSAYHSCTIVPIDEVGEEDQLLQITIIPFSVHRSQVIQLSINRTEE